MSNPLISVVIPIYNVENYLNECVDSVINQTYKNIEIILVDDGSPDNCPKICDEYAKKDNRIKVIHKKNGGLSDARNCGINQSNGEFIAFVDSDDYIEKDYLSSMYKNLKDNDVKIAACGYVNLVNDKDVRIINYENIEKKYSTIEAEKYLNIVGYFNVSSCNKLFDKKLFENIKFPLNKKSEDWFIMYKLIEKSGGLYYSSVPKYYYRQRVGSITKSSKPNLDCIEAAKEVYTYYKNNKYLLPFVAQSLIFAIVGIYDFLLVTNPQKEELKKYRKIALKYKKESTYREISFKRKMQLILFFYAPFVYNMIFKIFDRKRKR